MAKRVKRRPYDSPRRREQAGETRRAILEAARALFTDRGYVATAIDRIAARANVSPETVYASFGSKRALLSELVDISIAGDDEPRPILERAWVQQMRDEPDPRHRLLILARNGRRILERRAALDEVVRGAAAADPDIATLWEQGKAQRFAGQRELLRIVVGSSRLRKGLDLDTAADVIFAIGSPETYHLLVVDRGWSGARFEQWYGEELADLLFDRFGPGQLTDG
ncbi:MAG: TetR/AcrR family transcriptional regulator [Chloroflexota bacterium]|nr:TetR/AcrR family transcriptional regulator [Chloroflexota bacterium]